MYDSNRRDRYSLIAFGLILAALVLVAWVSQPIDNQITNKNDSQMEQAQQDDISHPVAGKDEFNPWHDSYAQWAMAVFSVVATIVSIAALIYLKRTLEATRDSVLETRRIGQAQTRAYLVADGGSFALYPRSYHYSIRLLNVGQSPARAIRANVVFGFFMGPTGRLTDIQGGKCHIGPIMAGSSGTLSLYFNDADNPATIVTPASADHIPKLPSADGEKLRTGDQKLFSIECVIGWDDVFGRRQTHWCKLSEGESEIFRDDEGKLCRKGTLISRGTTHYADE